MILPLILCLAFVGALGERENADREQLKLLDMKGQLKVVIDAAKYYLNEGAPSITKLFVVDNPDEIIRLESQLKKLILEDLLDQLVNSWTDMNSWTLRNYKVLKSLRDKAQIMLEKLKKNSLQSDEMKETVAEEVSELLNHAKQIFCDETGNITGLAQRERELLNMASRLHYDHVKVHLLKMVYDYRLTYLLNVSKDLSRKEYETIHEVWVMVSAWGKWAVLDLMAFIKEPLSDLNTETRKYIDNLMASMQELIDETMDNILELAVTIRSDNYDEGLVNLLTMMSEEVNPLYVLCRQ